MNIAVIRGGIQLRHKAQNRYFDQLHFSIFSYQYIIQ